tara:strand:+ start:13300 stop:13557 length:258 start_codon:yes stop_codon:yes gene_type:complete
MSRFLESSERLEKPMLNAVGNQAKQLIDELFPQIRLAAFENDGASIVEIKFGFEFDDNGAKCAVASEGKVTFPAKRVYAEEICSR